MTRPLRRFDPFRPIDVLTALWSSAATAPVSSGATVAYRTLFMTVRRLVVGRRLAVQLEDGDLTLTVTEFDSRLDVRGCRSASSMMSGSRRVTSVGSVIDSTARPR